MGKVQYFTVHNSSTNRTMFLKLMQSISMEQESRICILSKPGQILLATYCTVLSWGLYMGKQQTGTLLKTGYFNTFFYKDYYCRPVKQDGTCVSNEAIGW